jgi:hypothetical protein
MVVFPEMPQIQCGKGANVHPIGYEFRVTEMVRSIAPTPWERT